ncbi:MAG: autoinducer binding domain-containing protein [Alphaproteobacteria bacterium]
MYTLESFIENTNAETTADGVFSHFERILKHYGYDRICYSLITDHPSVSMDAGHAVMRNYPESWMTYYIENGYDKLDPVPKFCFISNRPFTWEFVTDHMNISTPQKQLMHEAKEEKLHDGIAVPMHGINGELSGVGLASSIPGITHDVDVLTKINAICRQFHLAYLELLQADNNDTKINLTNREREILHWAAEGKSDAVISDILGISYSTVRFHLNNAYTKLETNERVFAVTKAIRLGLILPNYVQ